MAEERPVQNTLEPVETDRLQGPFSEPLIPPPKQDLFQREEQKSLFSQPEQDDLRPISNVTASNKAYAESYVLDDFANYQDRRRKILENPTIEDEGLRRLREIQKEQQLIITGRLRPEELAKLSEEEKIQTIRNEVMRLGFLDDSVDLRDIALWEMLYAGNGSAPLAEGERAFRQVNPADLSALRFSYSKQSNKRMRDIVNEMAAAHGWQNNGEFLAEIIFQDFTPIFPILSRMGLTQEVMEKIGLEPWTGVKGFFLGSAREAMRDHLSNLNGDERNQVVQGLIEIKEWLESDEASAAAMTNYNVIELLSAVFTEEVFSGLHEDDVTDTFMGNLETFLEGVFSVGVLAKAGQTVRSAFSLNRNSRMRQALEGTDNTVPAATMDEMFQTDEISIDFNIQPDEAVPAMLPRPSAFVDNVDNLPDGTKELIRHNEQVRNEVLESTDAITGQALNKTDRTNVVNQVVRELDLDDGAHVMGRMNTLQRFENDTGIKVRVVVGETAERGYRRIEDVMDEMLDIDPNLEFANIMRVSDESGNLVPVFDNARDFARALTKGEVDAATAGRIAGPDGIDPTFYIVYDRERFWHTVDKQVLGDDTFLNTGIAPRALLPPNAKFGPDIFDNMLKAYMGEQRIQGQFGQLFKGFHRLGPDDQKFVLSAFEWMEDFGKNHGRAPTTSEVMARYDGITEGQLNGMISIRDGMDTMHELFNRRLYRDWQALGFKTARPNDPALAVYHGEVFNEATSVPRAQTYLDPQTGRMQQLSRADIDSIYNDGGRIMRLDMAVDASQEVGEKADLIILRADDYDVGDLSTKPLRYHPGYSMRFYDDPYYVVKETSGVRINGTTRAGAGNIHTEAIRTAGTAREGERFVRRATMRERARGNQNVKFKVVRAADISQTESTLFQKQTINREGRLFWDTRDFDRLPDVNNNRAQLEDGVKALERGVAIAARQLTHEDLLKSLKGAWKNEFGRLFSAKELAELDLKGFSDALKRMKANEVNVAERKFIGKAKELVDYFRLIEGVDGVIVPWMREQALNLAAWVGRTTGANTRAAEKYFQSMDPFRTMRTIAFNAFMVFRPVRQLLLQSSQIGYLAALDPLYVASPKFFKDSFMLRRGLVKRRLAGYDDGFSSARAAKAMGLTQKEYKVLVREFDRSGLIDLVDVHSFAGGTRQSKKLALPRGNSRLGTIGYRAKQIPVEVRQAMQRFGFNLGEQANQVFTYNLALRRAMERNGYDSLLQMTRSDWDKLRVESSNLALGMVRPNSFGYQTGAVGVATQFLSFSHKAALGLLGLNPAIKGADALKILFGTYTLYGANMFGARDWAAEQLERIGVPDQEIPGTEGATLIDLISAGLIETTFNMIGDMSSDDWKDIDLSPLAPGLDVERIVTDQIGGLLDQPAQTVFGAFGNVFSKTLMSYHFASTMMEARPDMAPSEKFTRSAAALMQGAFPAYNDAVMAYIGYQHNQWYTSAFEPMELRPTMNTLLARGIFGAQNMEQVGWYRLQNQIWEDEQNVKNVVEETRRFFLREIALYGEGKVTDAQFEDQIIAVANLFEEFPEGVRQEIVRRIWVESLEGMETVPRALYQALLNRAVDPRTLIGMIDRFELPPGQKQQLQQLVEETWQGRQMVESQIQSDLDAKKVEIERKRERLLIE